MQDDSENSDKFMAECSFCEEWYHKKCGKIDIKIFTDEEEAKLTCKKCK